MGIFGKLFKAAVGEPTPQPANDVDRYYEHLEAIRLLNSKGQYDRMLERCAASLPLLPALVRENGGGEFCLEVPAIDLGCRYWAALGDQDGLQAVSAALSSNPAVEAVYGEVLERAYADCDLSRRIKEYVRENPGAIQSKMGKALGVSGRDTGRIIATLDNLGKIVRTKSGSSYALHVPD
jgi:hypothetical protein